MKRYIIALAGILSLATLLCSTVGVQAAAANWQLTTSVPASPLNSSSFNVQYAVLSVDAASFSVSLYQDGTAPANLVATQTTSSDPNGVNGNSGAFPVTVSNGPHTFRVVAVRAASEDAPQTQDVSVDVDTVAPAAPTYLGKTQSGNTYTVKFTAPSDSDVHEVRIYSSTSSTFTANSATQVGVVAVSPGQTTSFTYTASSSTPRFNAVRAFDTAGNGSTAVGDPNIVVTTTTGGGATVTTAAATNTTPGTAAGSSSGATTPGQILGTSTTTPPATSTSTTTNKPGSVLSTTTTKKSTVTSHWSYFVVGLAIIVLVGGGWFFFRKGKTTP